MDKIFAEIAKTQGQNISLHRDYLNPQFAKVLQTIGFDQVYERAEGVCLWDSTGQKYLDFLSGYGVFGIGRNHPRLKNILKEYIDQDRVNLVQMEAPHLSGLLGKQLTQLINIDGLSKVFFTNSGTEAIEASLKFARAATGRSKIIHLEKSFHGLTLGSLSINGGKEFRDGFDPLLPDCVAIPKDNFDRLEHEFSQNKVAAFIFEPVQGKGVYQPSLEFLQCAARLCKKHGALLIADEIQTGLGRTGRWFGYEHYGLTPDMIAIAKTLSGGFVPVGALCYREDIYKKIYSRMDRCVVHSSTFGQNNLAMLCGLATLDIIAHENLLENVQNQSEFLLRELSAIAKQSEWIREVRGLGLMIGIEFGKPQSLKNKLKWNMVHQVDKGLFGELIVIPLMKEHHIITQVSGHHQDIVKLLPPYCLNRADAETFIAAFKAVVSQCGAMSGAMWDMGKNILKQAAADKTQKA